MTQLNALQLARGQDTIIDSQTISVNTDYNLPSTARKGQVYLILCTVSNNAVLTIKSSDGDTVDTIRTGYCCLVALQNDPTDGTHWKIMDAYEEGLWTPTLSASGGSAPSGVTYNTQTGRYSRKLNLVTVWMELQWNNISVAGTGNNAIAGSPYVILQTQTFIGSLMSNLIDYDESAGYNDSPVFYMANGESTYRIREWGDAVGTKFTPTANFGSGAFTAKSITATGTYLKQGFIIN